MNHTVLKVGVALHLDFPFSSLYLYNEKRALIYFHLSCSTMNTNLASTLKFLGDIKSTYKFSKLTSIHFLKE